MAVGRSAAAPAPVERRRVGMRLEDFSAGGILPEGDYLVKESQMVFFAYTNAANVVVAQTTAHKVVLQPFNVQTQKEEGDAQEHHYSVGDMTQFVPSEDGNFIDAIGQRATLSKQSNFYIEYNALVNAGLPEDKWMEHGAGMLVGMVGHIAHIPAPKRNIQKQSAVATGVAPQQQEEKKKQYEDTIPVFKTIIVAPWDKKGGAKSAPKPAAGKSTPAPASAPEPETAEGDFSRVADFIKEAVAANGGKLGRTKARLECHRKYNTAKVDAGTRDAELAVFNDDAILSDVLASVDCVIDGTNIELVQ